MAIKEEDWKRAAGLLKDEVAVRRKITPDAIIPLTARLIDQAEKIGCGARFAGAGGGGSLWALGEPEKIRQLREIWGNSLIPHKGAQILDCTIDAHGVR
jgi:D-glycero-alpha-D-manno-heptose-7-phosphate kinase